MLTFKQSISKYISGNLPADQLPLLATLGMEEGFDSPSLVMLAGIEKNESSYILERYFELAIDELDFVVSSKKDAALHYANTIVEDAIAGKKDIIKAMTELKNKHFDIYWHNEDEKDSAISCQSLFALYWEYDDLINPLVIISVKDSRQQLIEELKAEILDELKKWNAAIKSYLCRNNYPLA